MLKHSIGLASNGEQETPRQVHESVMIRNRKQKIFPASLRELHIHITYTEKSSQGKNNRVRRTVLNKQN